MHTMIGYSWDEIASIAAVLSVIFSGIYWLIRHGANVFDKNIRMTLRPFGDQLRKLNDNINKLNTNFQQQKANFDRLEKRVDAHDRRLDRHHERIKSLEKKEAN